MLNSFGNYQENLVFLKTLLDHYQTIQEGCQAKTDNLLTDVNIMTTFELYVCGRLQSIAKTTRSGGSKMSGVRKQGKKPSSEPNILADRRRQIVRKLQESHNKLSENLEVARQKKQEIVQRELQGQAEIFFDEIVTLTEKKNHLQTEFKKIQDQIRQYRKYAEMEYDTIETSFHETLDEQESDQVRQELLEPVDIDNLITEIEGKLPRKWAQRTSRKGLTIPFTDTSVLARLHLDNSSEFLHRVVTFLSNNNLNKYRRQETYLKLYQKNRDFMKARMYLYYILFTEDEIAQQTVKLQARETFKEMLSKITETGTTWRPTTDESSQYQDLLEITGELQTRIDSWKKIERQETRKFRQHGEISSKLYSKTKALQEEVAERQRSEQVVAIKQDRTQMKEEFFLVLTTLTTCFLNPVVDNICQSPYISAGEVCLHQTSRDSLAFTVKALVTYLIVSTSLTRYRPVERLPILSTLKKESVTGFLQNVVRILGISELVNLTRHLLPSDKLESLEQMISRLNNHAGWWPNVCPERDGFWGVLGLKEMFSGSLSPYFYRETDTGLETCELSWGWSGPNVPSDCHFKMGTGFKLNNPFWMDLDRQSTGPIPGTAQEQYSYLPSGTSPGREFQACWKSDDPNAPDFDNKFSLLLDMFKDVTQHGLPALLSSLYNMLNSVSNLGRRNGLSLLFNKMVIVVFLIFLFYQMYKYLDSLVEKETKLDQSLESGEHLDSNTEDIMERTTALEDYPEYQKYLNQGVISRKRLDEDRTRLQLKLRDLDEEIRNAGTDAKRRQLIQKKQEELQDNREELETKQQEVSSQQRVDVSLLADLAAERAHLDAVETRNLAHQDALQQHQLTREIRSAPEMVTPERAVSSLLNRGFHDDDIDRLAPLVRKDSSDDFVPLVRQDSDQTVYSENLSGEDEHSGDDDESARLRKHLPSSPRSPISPRSPRSPRSQRSPRVHAEVDEEGEDESLMVRVRDPRYDSEGRFLGSKQGGGDKPTPNFVSLLIVVSRINRHLKVPVNLLANAISFGQLEYKINVIDRSRLETASGHKIEILEGGYRQQDERYKKYKKYKQKYKKLLQATGH